MNSIKKYYRWAKFYFSNRPFYVIFYITARCNARCIHCFNWQLAESTCPRKELSLQEIEQIAKKWGNILIINLAGGESYLRKDLPEIVDIFKRYTGAEIISIPSNGILTGLILEVINRLLREHPDLFFRFSFSVDGIGQEHDEIRGVPGAFDKVSDTIKRLASLKQRYKNFSVITSSCFMHANQDSLIDTLKYIRRELNADIQYVTHIRGNPRLPQAAENLCNQKYKKVIDYLAKLRYRGFKQHPLAGFISGVSSYTNEKVFENLKTDKRNFECYAIKKMIVLDDTGEVKICEMLPDSLGNLRDHDYDIKAVISSGRAETEYGKIKRHECNCTWECAINTGIIYNHREYLPVFRSALRQKQEGA